MIFLNRLLFLPCWIAIALLTSCVSKPPRDFTKISEGYWKAEVALKDKVNNKNFFFSMKINAIKNKKLRMDVISPLGDVLASLALRGNELEYYLAQENRYYEGPSTPKVMVDLIQMPMNPKWFHHIFFDTPVRSKMWSCTNDNSGFLQECKNLKSGLKVSWTERSGDQRVVVIQNKTSYIKMALKNYSPKVESRKSLFQIRQKPAKIKQ